MRRWTAVAVLCVALAGCQKGSKPPKETGDPPATTLRDPYANEGFGADRHPSPTDPGNLADDPPAEEDPAQDALAKDPVAAPQGAASSPPTGRDGAGADGAKKPAPPTPPASTSVPPPKGPQEKAVRQAAESFLKALKAADADTLLSLLPAAASRGDANVKAKLKATFFNPLIMAVTSHTQHKVKAVKVSGGEATVTLDMKTPDMKAIEQEVKGRLLGLAQQSGGPPSREALMKAMAQAIREAKAPLNPRTTTMNLVWEADGWKVSKPPQAQSGQ